LPRGSRSGFGLAKHPCGEAITINPGPRRNYAEILKVCYNAAPPQRRGVTLVGMESNMGKSEHSRNAENSAAKHR